MRFSRFASDSWQIQDGNQTVAMVITWKPDLLCFYHCNRTSTLHVNKVKIYVLSFYNSHSNPFFTLENDYEGFNWRNILCVHLKERNIWYRKNEYSISARERNWKDDLERDRDQSNKWTSFSILTCGKKHQDNETMTRTAFTRAR